MSDPFRFLLRVRYSECDAQKVVYNARYGDYIDLAVTEFFRALGYEAELSDGRLDYQLVRQCIDWKSPARFDDVVAVEVACAAKGNTSFRMHTRFLHAGNGTLLAEGETVYVLVDTELRKLSLPESLRESLDDGARGCVADHAGQLRRA